MGFFEKIKGMVTDFINSGKERAAKAREEEERRREEARRRAEEANRLNPDKKGLDWFNSADGIEAFNMYITAQNYLLEETIKAEREAKYSEYSLEVVVSVFHKEAKIPAVYFGKLADAIGAQALSYVGPSDLLVKLLSMQAKPFYMDDDGEPQAIEPLFSPEEIVSVEKNPILNFAKNFNCFTLGDDEQGSWKDKFELWKNIMIWLGLYGGKDAIANNPWIFSKETYFNEIGTVRKLKGFCKKCIELVADEKGREYFERTYNECE